MRVWRRAGLTARIAVALAVVAVSSVGISTVLANLGLRNRVEQAEQSRTASAAEHASEVAAELYARNGGWTSGTRSELSHAGSIGGYQLAVAADGAKAPSVGVARAVTVDGREVGTIVLVPSPEGFLARENDSLTNRLDRLHLLAASLALLLGVLTAPLIASALTRPLRRIAVAAERLRGGELGVRVTESGPSEITAVGAALNELAASLEREETLRREAAADVAHEFRTPLSGVIARIEAAQDHVVDDDAENLAAMRLEARRLAELIDDLELLADAQRPGLTMNRSPLDLSALARERLDVRRNEFASKGVATSEDLAPQAIVFADRARLTQVIDNLLTNALRYTDAGEVRVDVRRSGDKVILAVADTGIGMDEHETAHVFERFWRADPSRSRGTGGTGIGLAIAKELTEAQNGAISVESSPDAGSTFTITLPAASRH